MDKNVGEKPNAIDHLLGKSFDGILSEDSSVEIYGDKTGDIVEI